MTRNAASTRTVTLTRRASSGQAQIERVEVSTDGGDTSPPPSSTRRYGAHLARLGASTGTRPTAGAAVAAAPPTPPGRRAAARPALEPEGLREQRSRAVRVVDHALDWRAHAHLRPASGPFSADLGDFIGAIQGYLDSQEHGDYRDLLHRGPARDERDLRRSHSCRTTCSTQPGC